MQIQAQLNIILLCDTKHITRCRNLKNPVQSLFIFLGT